MVGSQILTHGSYYDAYVASLVEQPAPEAPTDVLIVVPLPPIDVMNGSLVSRDRRDKLRQWQR